MTHYYMRHHKVTPVKDVCQNTQKVYIIAEAHGSSTCMCQLTVVPARLMGAAS